MTRYERIAKLFAKDKESGDVKELAELLCKMTPYCSYCVANRTGCYCSMPSDKSHFAYLEWLEEES